MVDLLRFVYLPPLRALLSRSPAYMRCDEIDRLLYPTNVGPERSHSPCETVLCVPVLCQGCNLLSGMYNGKIFASSRESGPMFVE